MRKLEKVRGVAKLLDVTEPRLYDLIRQRKIPGVVHIGRQIRVDLEQLEAWIKEGGEALSGGWKNE